MSGAQLNRELWLPGDGTFSGDSNASIRINIAPDRDSKVKESVLADFNICPPTGVSVAGAKGVPNIIFLKEKPIGVFA